MWSDEDEFGETPIEKIMNETLPVPTTQTLGYHRNVDQLAEEDAVSNEERPARRGLNRPMHTFPGTPEYWVCNARKDHGESVWYDTNGAIHKNQCHCVGCMLKDHPSLNVGDPAPSQEHSPEELKEMGFAGLYRPPPPYAEPCPLCGKVISLYMEVDKKSEVVHVRCLSDNEREVLRNVGYSDPHMIRRKKDDDADRKVDDGSGDHECPSCRCAGEGGEPVQGDGGEGGPLAEEGREGEGAGQRPGQPGVDVHPEQAGEGAEAGPGQADAGEEAPDAEEDSG